MKLLIQNGQIVDGTGKGKFYGSVAVKDGRIEAVAPFIEGTFDQTLDAGGHVICPGFIDTHSHSDLQVLVDPFIEAKIRQGITTEVLGQDGISMAPLPSRYIADWRKNLAGLEGDSDEIDWGYGTTSGYFAQMEIKGVSLNTCYLVPHGNVRMEAMGLDSRAPSAGEQKSMEAILQRELEAGAAGFSTGLIYIPCAYADLDELTRLCRIVAQAGKVFVIHQRSEADDILSSMEEVLEIGRRTGVKIHFSHFKVCGRKNWEKIGDALKILDMAAEEGLNVSFDQYPYVAGSTMLSVILPPWVHAGGTGKLVERLRDREVRAKIVGDIRNGLLGWDNFIDFAGLDGIYITSVMTAANRDLIGKNLLQMGEIRKKDPYDAAFDLLIEEENGVGMVDFYGEEEHIAALMQRPEQNFCTDGLLGGKPHPRVYGAFPRVLGRYVREQNILSLEAAIHKMTGKAAAVFGLEDRGTLERGKAADIVVLDPEKIVDTGSYTDPVRYPEGIVHVLVNGETVYSQGVCRHRTAGRLLRVY